MANSYLIEIGMNDTTADIVRKCNANFRQLSRTNNANLKHESTRTDKVIDGAVGSVRDAVDHGIDDLRQETQRLIEELKEQIKNINAAPPIHTYIWANYDPNKQWPGTTWEQIAEGTFLMSSGETYLPGNEYGSNTHNHSAGSYIAAIGSTNSDIGAIGFYASGNPANYGYRSSYTIRGTATRDETFSHGTAILGNSANSSTIPQSIAIPLWHRTK